MLSVDDLNTYKTKALVALLLFAKSDNEITLPGDFNLRVSMYQDNEWIEIGGESSQFPDQDVEMPIHNPSFVVFQPKLNNLEQNYIIRAYVFGEMKTEDRKNEVAAAYADVYLTPKFTKSTYEHK